MEHTLLSKRGNRLAIVDQSGGRISGTEYDAIEPISGTQYVLASNKGFIEVVNTNGDRWLRPEGIPPQAEQEKLAESPTASRTSPDIFVDIHDSPSMKILEGQIFVWQKDRWRVFSLRNGKSLGEFSAVTFSRSGSDSSIFWARKGRLQGYFEVKGELTPLVQETLFGPPDDFDYPLWSMIREADGWALHQRAAPNRLRLLRRLQETGPSRHLYHTDKVYLVLNQGREERWGICSITRTWQEEQQCLTRWQMLQKAKDQEQILRAAGLHYALKSDSSTSGPVQIEFPGGALTAVHENCWLDQPVLVCRSSADRDSMIRFGANPANEYQQWGTSDVYTVYRVSDGKNMTPAGVMKTQPLTGAGNYFEIKTTEGIHWTSPDRTMSYRLDCTEGFPVLSYNDRFPLWRWQARTPGFHGNVDPALKRIMGELRFWR